MVTGLIFHLTLVSVSRCFCKVVQHNPIQTVHTEHSPSAGEFSVLFYFIHPENITYYLVIDRIRF